jgi:hypothetical protein
MSAIAVHKERLPDTVFKAVIIYDDFDSATYATALLERVALRADEAIKWDIKPWRLDVLKQPTLAALTVAVAANADLIVLALNRIHSTPVELLAWLKNWAEHRRIEDAAMLALSPDGSHTQSKYWNDIRAFAKQRDLTFLGNHNVWNDGNSASLVHRLHQRKQLVALVSLPSMAERLPTPHHWGINE